MVVRDVMGRYWQSTRASAVEFALMLPILFFLLLAILDGGHLFAQQAKAQQIAESLVRTARSLDVQVTSTNVLPLTDASRTLLRNIAARMQTQAPDDVNYIWIGRYVRPLDGSPVRQTLPDGMNALATNKGLVLAGQASYALEARDEALTAFDTSLQAGDIVYVVTVRFTHWLLLPLPPSLKKLPMEVRFAL